MDGLMATMDENGGCRDGDGALEFFWLGRRMGGYPLCYQGHCVLVSLALCA